MFAATCPRCLYRGEKKPYRWVAKSRKGARHGLAAVNWAVGGLGGWFGWVVGWLGGLAAVWGPGMRWVGGGGGGYCDDVMGIKGGEDAKGGVVK